MTVFFVVHDSVSLIPDGVLDSSFGTVPSLMLWQRRQGGSWWALWLRASPGAEKASAIPCSLCFINWLCCCHSSAAPRLVYHPLFGKFQVGCCY